MRITILNRTDSRIPTKAIQHDLQITRRMLARTRRRLPTHLAVVFVPNHESRALNRTYRKKRHATNVLSFHYHRVGEIIIAPRVIQREARRRGWSFTARLRWMVVHGLLHLAGVHHELSPRHAQAFERLETSILNQRKISIVR